MSSKKPQLYPTRYLRSAFDVVLKVLDKVPLFRRGQGDSASLRSEVPVSVLIPAHPKDIWIATYAVKYLRKNLLHPISEIVVVSPSDEVIEQFCQREGLTWLNENATLGLTIKEIEERFPERAKNRKGWMFQQLIKLSADHLCQEEHILVLDADTLLLQKKAFLAEGTLSLDYSHERNLLYLKAYRSLLGDAPSSWKSFVTHYMFMEKSLLLDMKEKIAAQTGKKWDEAILSLVSEEIWTEKDLSIRPFNFFSEYETYGNFAKQYHPSVRSHYFRNFSPRNFDPSSIDVDKFVAELPSFYQWASFHSYHAVKDQAETRLGSSE